MPDGVVERYEDFIREHAWLGSRDVLDGRGAGHQAGRPRRGGSALQHVRLAYGEGWPTFSRELKTRLRSRAAELPS